MKRTSCFASCMAIIKDETLQVLLGYKSVENIRRLKRGDQKWGVDTLFKLTWILDIPFENLIVQDFTENYQVSC